MDFNWQENLASEIKEKRTHDTKHFPHPTEPGKYICIQSMGLLHAFTDKGFEDIKTELPDYNFPNGIVVIQDVDKHPILDLPSWGEARIEDDGKTVRVYDKLGKSIFAYKHLLSVPNGIAPYEVWEKGGNKVKDSFSDKESVRAWQELRKSQHAEDLTWHVENGKLYAKFPTVKKNIPSVQLYDATDTSSTNNGDAQITNSVPNTNLGTAVELYQDGWTLNKYHSLIKFTLSSGTGTISTVKLFFYQGDYYGAAGYNVELYEVRRAWTEAGVTWNKYDGTNSWSTPGATDTTNDIYPTIVNSWARTNAVGWMSGKDIGTGATNPISGLTWGSVVSLLMKPSTTTGTYDEEWYSSKEGANPPYVEITYTAAASASHNLMMLLGVC